MKLFVTFGKNFNGELKCPRVGKKPIEIKGVEVIEEGDLIPIKGKLGVLERTLNPNIKISKDNRS